VRVSHRLGTIAYIFGVLVLLTGGWGAVTVAILALLRRDISSVDSDRDVGPDRNNSMDGAVTSGADTGTNT